MRIEPSFPSCGCENNRVNPATRNQPNDTWTDFTRHRSLETSLAEVADVRASEVARGKALIADPNYPSQEQVKKIARTLAGGWSRSNSRLE